MRDFYRPGKTANRICWTWKIGANNLGLLAQVIHIISQKLRSEGAPSDPHVLWSLKTFKVFKSIKNIQAGYDIALNNVELSSELSNFEA